MTQLDISANVFSGTLPLELVSLTALKVIDMSKNILTGAIPSEFGLLDAVEVLNLAGNSLQGIPLELGRLSTLQAISKSAP